MGATGDTGRAAVKESLALDLKVRAMVHSIDKRSTVLEELGAEAVAGDLLDINTIRSAMEGVDAAYLCWPVKPGVIHATVNFAQAAKEAGVSTIINLSQRSANRESTSNSCRDSFIAEEVLNWSGPGVIHLRPTYFLEWLLYPVAVALYAEGYSSHAGRQGPALADRGG
ncbi:MAG TPA: NAD(P)H-binding protein [Candidatus Methylacidiphilales bacterium]